MMPIRPLVSALMRSAGAAVALSVVLVGAATLPVVAQDAAFSADQKKAIEKIIKDYLVTNPEVLMDANAALEAKMEKIQAEKIKVGLAENSKAIYRSEATPVAGKKDGDITVAEFFDYNCGFCKKSFADISKLIAADPKVRVVFKELPILSKGSEEAARVALAAGLQGKYWEVHSGLLDSKAQANEASALKIAEKAGLDMAKLKKDADGPEVKAELASARELAQKLGINGTPHFLVGDKSIGGAPQDLLAQLTGHIADLRKSGCKTC
jgi:protein-disulfide isomerase